jgi:hypothetical protein
LSLLGTDDVGNEGTSSITLRKDTTAPNAAITTPAENSPFKDPPTFTATITDPSPGLTDIQGAEYKVVKGAYDSDWQIAALTTGSGTTRDVSQQISSAIWNNASFTDGNFTLYVRGTDAVGNVVDSGSPVANRTFMKDTVPPTASQLTLSAPIVSGHSVVHLTAVISDASPSSNIQKAQFRVGTGAPVDMTGSGAPPVNVSADIDTTSWSVGEYTVQVRGIDNAGNEGAWSTSMSFDVPAIEGVTVSNLTSSAAIVSWTTTIPAIDVSQTTNGTVRYHTAQPTQDQQGNWTWPGALTATDTRSKDDVHWVLIRNLEPNTKYYYQVTSGATVEGNPASLPSFTTAKVGNGAPYQVYGYVKKTDTTTPAPEVIVHVTVTRGTTTSSPLSALTASDGSWYVELGNLKHPTTGSPLFWAVGDNISVRVRGASDGTRTEGTSPQKIVRSAGSNGDASSITLSKAGPTASELSTDPNPTNGTITNLTARVSALSASNANITGAEYRIDSGTWGGGGRWTPLMEVITTQQRISESSV